MFACLKLAWQITPPWPLESSLSKTDDVMQSRFTCASCLVVPHHSVPQHIHTNSSSKLLANSQTTCLTTKPKKTPPVVCNDTTSEESRAGRHMTLMRRMYRPDRQGRKGVERLYRQLPRASRRRPQRCDQRWRFRQGHRRGAQEHSCMYCSRPLLPKKAVQLTILPGAGHVQ